jgi:hypothetical protein
MGSFDVSDDSTAPTRATYGERNRHGSGWVWSRVFTAIRYLIPRPTLSARSEQTVRTRPHQAFIFTRHDPLI